MWVVINKKSKSTSTRGRRRTVRETFKGYTRISDSTLMGLAPRCGRSCVDRSI
jgi:hypothetical protein